MAPDLPGVSSLSRVRPPTPAGGASRGGGLLLALLLAAAAGCGSDSAPAPTTPPPPPPEPPPVGPPPDTLDLPDDPEVFFLEVWELPGFVPIEYALGRPPRHAITVGGEFFYEGPTIEIFPGPLLPNIQRGQFSDEDLASVIEAAAATGVSQVQEEDILQPTTGPILADAPTYEIHVRDRDGLHLLRIAALGSIAHTDPRVDLVWELLGRIDHAIADTGSETYEGELVQVYVNTDPAPSDPSVLNERPWPLPDPPPGDDEQGFVCRVYEGQVAADLLETFAAANHGTRWDYQDTLHQILARSLLPREEPCLR